MRFIKLTIFMLFPVLLIITACAPKEPAVQTVEAYLNAIVTQDDTTLITLVCEEYQFDVMLEMDSFLAVSPQLQDLSCAVNGEENGTTLVTCSGSILATYNDEQQNLDLAGRIFKVINAAGEWQMCGYQTP